MRGHNGHVMNVGNLVTWPPCVQLTRGAQSAGVPSPSSGCSTGGDLTGSTAADPLLMTSLCVQRHTVVFPP